jgi:CRP/FNR family cyclic AMP-dependent transcriptional regulator
LRVGQSLFSDASRHGKMFVPREPGLSYIKNGRMLYFYEPGDLIGVEEYFAKDAIEIRAEFAVTLDAINYDEFFAQVHSNHNLTMLWHQCLSCKFQLLSLIIDTLTKEPRNFTPEMRHYQAGELIVRQGDPAPDVLNMVEGHADVFVDDIKVGEVLSDEIFGALATLTDTPRTATVIASRSAMVLALPKEKFVELIETRPHTALKMVADMARSVVELNKRVVGLSYLKG